MAACLSCEGSPCHGHMAGAEFVDDGRISTRIRSATVNIDEEGRSSLTSKEPEPARVSG